MIVQGKQPDVETVERDPNLKRLERFERSAAIERFERLSACLRVASLYSYSDGFDLKKGRLSLYRTPILQTSIADSTSCVGPTRLSWFVAYSSRTDDVFIGEQHLRRV